MPNSRGQSLHSGSRTVDAVLVIGVTLLVTAAPLLPRKAAAAVAAVTAVLTALAWYKRCVAAAPLSAFCVICFGLLLSGVRFIPIVLGLGLIGYAGIVRGAPWLRGTATWIRRGSFNATVRILCAATWLLAAGALLCWYLLLRPNVADIVETFVPAQPLAVLIAGGVIFSIFNAAVEEGAYRGVIMHALDQSLGPGVAALLLQAAAFGAVHIHGFPRGWVGVGLATIYGLLMGIIRRRAGGVLAPWVAHVLTDVVIAGIVLFLARLHLALQMPA